MSASHPTALGVYIFAGGFTLGMRESFEVLGHLEDGRFGVATVEANKLVPVVHTVPSTWPVQDFAGVDVIYGNPPCAPWSAAGTMPKQTERLKAIGVGMKYEVDPRVECVRKQFALLGQLRPRAWVWESVDRAFTVGKPFVDMLTEQAHDLGYAVTWVRVDGAWTGLPQRRRRFFFVAHDIELPFVHPGKLPGTVDETWAPFPDASTRHPTCQGEVRGQLIESMQYIQPGEGAIDGWQRWMEAKGADWRNPPRHPKTGNVISRPNFLLQRLHGGKHAPTVVSGGCLIHPHEPRFITVKETQLLCGYPPDYEFVGRDAYAQISKAVLPPVGAWLGRILAAGVKTDVRITDPGAPRLVDYRKPLPQEATA